MNEIEQHILSSEKFRGLVRKRNRFMWLLFTLTLVLFFGYTGVIMFAPSVLGIPIWPGAAIKIGVPLGMAVVVVSFALTGVYVYRANKEFDRLTAEILDEARKHRDDED